MQLSRFKLLISSFYVVIFVLLTKFILFLKEAVIAKEIGVSQELDAFVIAFMIISFFANFLFGTLGTAFLPAFIRINRYSAEKANQLFFSLVLSGLGVLLAVSLLLLLLNDVIVSGLVKNFTEEQVDLAKSLGKLLLPYLFFFFISHMLAVYLNAKGKNFYLATYLAFPSIAIILFLLLSNVSPPVYSLVYGSNAGMLVSCIVLFVIAHKNGLSVKPRIKTNKVFWITLNQWAPLIIAQLLVSVNLVVDKVMAAAFPPGSVSTLEYGSKLYGAFSTVSMTTITIIFLPHFSKRIASKDYRLLNTDIKKSLLFIFVVFSLVTLFILLFSPYIVQLLFERGAFTSTDTANVSEILNKYIVGIVFNVAGLLGVRVISAMQKNYYITLLGIISIVANIVFNIILSNIYGLSGIALSTSAVYFLTFIGIWWVVFRELKKKLPNVWNIWNN